MLPRRRLDDRAARPEQAGALGGLDHRQADPVLDRAAGVEHLELGEDQRLAVGRAEIAGDARDARRAACCRRGRGSTGRTPSAARIPRRVGRSGRGRRFPALVPVQRPGLRRSQVSRRGAGAGVRAGRRRRVERPRPPAPAAPRSARSAGGRARAPRGSPRAAASRPGRRRAARAAHVGGRIRVARRRPTYSSSLPAIAIGTIGAPVRRAISAAPNRNGASRPGGPATPPSGIRTKTPPAANDRPGRRDVLVDADAAAPDRQHPAEPMEQPLPPAGAEGRRPAAQEPAPAAASGSACMTRNGSIQPRWSGADEQVAAAPAAARGRGARCGTGTRRTGRSAKTRRQEPDEQRRAGLGRAAEPGEAFLRAAAPGGRSPRARARGRGGRRRTAAQAGSASRPPPVPESSPAPARRRLIGSVTCIVLVGGSVGLLVAGLDLVVGLVARVVLDHRFVVVERSSSSSSSVRRRRGLSPRLPDRTRPVAEHQQEERADDHDHRDELRRRDAEERPVVDPQELEDEAHHGVPDEEDQGEVAGPQPVGEAPRQPQQGDASRAGPRSTRTGTAAGSAWSPGSSRRAGTR